MTKYKISTPHSDENPELTNPDDSGGPLAAHSIEGSAVSELYDKDRTARSKGWLGVTEEEAQHITEYEDSEGNYWNNES